MKKGFTLIELLVVIVIIAILAAVVFVALNPVARFADARNAQRWNDVNNILTAIHECIVDEEGIVTACGLTAPMNEKELSTKASQTCTADPDADPPVVACEKDDGTKHCLDLSTKLAAYLAKIPKDPKDPGTETDDARTRYTVEVDANGVVWVRACDPEIGTADEAPDIHVAR